MDNGLEEIKVEAGTIWGNVTERVRHTVGEAAWNTWFVSLEPVKLEGSVLTLKAPSTLTTQRIAEKYLGLLEKEVTREAGSEFKVTLCNAVVEATQHLSPQDSPSSRPRKPSPLFDGTGSGNGYSKSDRSSQFDPRYSFDDFVIGSSNRFAHAASLSVAEQPSGSYNPLFIHGDAGLGKTHLLHAIGNYIRDQYPDLYVKYVSTETILNEFVEAIKKNRMSEFKARYRECDVLLVDDIQFLEKKEQLQEEFFHTFNSLYSAHKQIVLTSDRPPKAISTLEDRLISRFAMGLITDIQAPDVETRMAIVRKKAEEKHYSIPSDVLAMIAESVTDNIRELEGALNRVTAFSKLTKQPITLALAESVLDDIVGGASKLRTITIKDILKATCQCYTMSMADLLGDSRKRPIATARQVGMYIARELTELSYPVIGREFGGRDHTTVMHAVEKISIQMQSSMELYEEVSELIKSLKASTPVHVSERTHAGHYPATGKVSA